MNQINFILRDVNFSNINSLNNLYRHCLWVLGNAATLTNSGSVWQKLVLDAKNRNCFHNANEDEGLARAINTALVELGDLTSLFSTDSVLFTTSKWKVCCILWHLANFIIKHILSSISALQRRIPLYCCKV